MKFEEIRQHVIGIPFITVTNARALHDPIIEEKPKAILELGIAHGTATCYMAAALDEIGEGRIVSVDLESANYEPTCEEQLSRAGLDHFVEVHRMRTGYTWFLHDEIVRNTVNDICVPKYDLCIIDGPKNWNIDGFSFFLVDKLLKENGWIIFDDYAWTYEMSDKLRDVTDGVTHRHLSQAELETPHIREVFELLVKQHASYSKFVVQPINDWAIAQKCKSERKTYTVEYRKDKKDAYAMIEDGLMRFGRWLYFRRGKK